MNNHWTFLYFQEQREQWQSGQLAKHWHTRFPDIFDDDDLRITAKQPNKHFYEWLSAIHLYHSTGWHCLVEKYQFQNHKRKQDIVKRLFQQEWIQAFAQHSTQMPDLLVYKPDYSDFFFCEVKGPKDRMRREQQEFFDFIEQTTCRPVHTVKFREIR